MLFQTLLALVYPLSRIRYDIANAYRDLLY